MIWLRRILLGSFVLGAAALLAFGPRPDVGEKQGVVVIDYWEKWGGLEGSQMQQIVDQFNETVGTEKGIHVRYLSVSRVNHKTLVSTAAGVPPDVAGVWVDQIPQFASLGALEPLDEALLDRQYGINADYYKPVYWEGCRYEGRLYGLVSTPWAVALHWNKQIFQDNAQVMEQAGLDPSRPPRTIEELDRYAAALDVIHPDGYVERAGFLPLHPGWWLPYMSIWFGGDVYEPQSRQLTLNTPANLAAFEWIQRYPRKLGVDSMSEFNQSLGNPSSPTAPFVVGTLAMEQQGPWRANYFEQLKPSLNRWRMSKQEEHRLPPEARKQNYAWGAAPFPTVDGRNDVTFAGFDVLVIPRGARHKREALEFIAYVNRQDVMEKLCSMHSKNSPLRQISDDFVRNHPNPYLDVFEALASSPNARTTPRAPTWIETFDAMNTAAQRVYLLEQTPEEALDEVQRRMQHKLDRFYERDRQRKLDKESAR